MKDLLAELKEKEEELQDLLKARSKAYCNIIHSSESEVSREMRIEELEHEILRLERMIEEKNKKSST